MHYRDRYRDMATSLGFEGHMAWPSDAMTAVGPEGDPGDLEVDDIRGSQNFVSVSR